jgi:5-methyltetrahydropteroyltriglutamate--homocysteine methyltransferase
VFDVSYENSVEVYMERLNADVWTIEATEQPQELKLLAPYKDTAKKKIAIGAISHRQLQVEPPEDVAALAREALKYINPENLILSSDCGFGRAGNNRMIAFYKAVSLSLGANIVRAELGVDEHYIPAADPELQVDVLAKPDESKLFAGLNG